MFEVIKKRYNVKDIKQAIIQACKDDRFDVKQFGKLKNEKEIFDFVKNNIKYVEDGEKYQIIKRPTTLLRTGFGDCKSFTVFCSRALQHAGIPHEVVFVNFKNQHPDAWHVYTVTKNTTLDATLPNFGDKPGNINKKVTFMIHPEAIGKGLQIGNPQGGTHPSITKDVIESYPDVISEIFAPAIIARMMTADEKPSVGPAPLVAAAAVKLAPVVIPMVTNVINGAQNAKWAAAWGAFGQKISKLMERGFDAEHYLANNPDVNAAIRNGNFLAEYGNDIAARAAGHFVESVIEKDELRIGGFPFIDFEFLSRNLASTYPQARRLYTELVSFPDQKPQLLGNNQIASLDAKFINSEWGKGGADAFKAGDAKWQPFPGNETIQTTQVRPVQGDQIAATAVNVAAQVASAIPAGFDIFAPGSHLEIARMLNISEREAKSLARRVQRLDRRIQSFAQRAQRDGRPLANPKTQVIMYLSGLPSGIDQTYTQGRNGRPVSALRSMQSDFNKIKNAYAAGLRSGPLMQNLQQSAPVIQQQVIQQAQQVVQQPVNASAVQPVGRPNVQAALGSIASNVVTNLVNQQGGFTLPKPRETLQNIGQQFQGPQGVANAVALAGSFIKPGAGGKPTVDWQQGLGTALSFGSQFIK